MGRHNRRAYRDSEHLRDELPLHAGDRLELWVPLALLAMVAICVVLYVVFKRIGWL
jgi:Mg2+ and Co2+ transporter CorA